MGIRESINRRKGVGFAIGVATIVGSVALLVWSNSSGIPHPLSQVFYSDDDGQTYFADDIAKPYPFNHNGKEADRAYVFQVHDGKPFVAYLERYTKSAFARLTASYSSNANQPQATAATDLEVKKPGQTKWVPEQSRDGIAISSPKGPDGGFDIKSVFP
jgi:hypothetical protein